MLYVIRKAGMTDHYLLPACFDPEAWSSEDMPDRARKFACAADAALCCAALPGLSVVVPLPGIGREYEPAPVPDHRPDVPTAGAARSFMPLGGNGKVAVPAGAVAATNGEAD